MKTRDNQTYIRKFKREQFSRREWINKKGKEMWGIE